VPPRPHAPGLRRASAGGRPGPVSPVPTPPSSPGGSAPILSVLTLHDEPQPRQTAAFAIRVGNPCAVARDSSRVGVRLDRWGRDAAVQVGRIRMGERQIVRRGRLGLSQSLLTTPQRLRRITQTPLMSASIARSVALTACGLRTVVPWRR
jgi:hypothetical protein